MGSGNDGTIEISTLTRDLVRPDAERPKTLSRDLQRFIQVEVMVPRLRLPTFSGPRGPELPSSPGGAGTDLDEPEQVRLHVIPTPGQAQPQHAHNLITGKVLTYTSKRGPFHLFRLRYYLQQGQGLLIQIARRFHHLFPSADDALAPVTTHIDDELNCLLEYRSATDTSAGSPITIIPGIQRIVITLDAQGQPLHSSIDGADS